MKVLERLCIVLGVVMLFWAALSCPLRSQRQGNFIVGAFLFMTAAGVVRIIRK